MARIFEKYLDYHDPNFWTEDGQLSSPTILDEGALNEMRDTHPDLHGYHVERTFERFMDKQRDSDYDEIVQLAEETGLTEDLDNPLFNLRNDVDFDPYRLWNPLAYKATLREAVYEMTLEWLILYGRHMAGISEDEAERLVDLLAAPVGNGSPPRPRVYMPGDYFRRRDWSVRKAA